MIDLETEATERAMKAVQKQEDEKILSYLKVAVEKDIINKYICDNPIKAIYVGVLKYGWEIASSSVNDRYAVAITPGTPYSPLPISMSLGPEEYRW